MLRPADNYFSIQQEPLKSCLLALRQLILSYDTHITEAWKYGMPFYCYNGKMCCYLWTHKQTKQPYLGGVEGKLVAHPQLLQEKRARMKILLFDPEEDIPLGMVKGILKQVVAVYK